MSLPERTEILIVGAGPTGLACCLSLHIHGCKDVTIVDAFEHGEDSSRAIVVHSATLEALDTVGCTERLIREGNKHTILKAWDGSRFHEIGDFSTLAPYTKFPFVLVIPQYVTERILGEQVRERDVHVYRPHKVVDMKINEQDANMTDVIFEDGQVVQARYVIGADGAKSVVRQSAGIGFVDPHGDYDDVNTLSQMVLADVVFTKPPPPEFQDMVFVLSTENAFLYIPLPESAYNVTERIYRIGAGIPPSMGSPPPDPPIEYLQNLMDKYGPGTIQLPFREPEHITIAQALWSTRFRTHSSIADTFFTRLGWTHAGQYYSGGVILLIGDAAHIHSPAGGQGMNLGLRDAVTLGAALAAHHSWSEPPVSPSEYRELDQPLQDWANTRRASGLTIIALTKTLMKIAGLPNKTIIYLGVIPINWAKLRNLAFAFLSPFRVVKRMTAWRLSGLGVR